MSAETDQARTQARLLAELSEAREHCDEWAVYACVDQLIALCGGSPRAAETAIEDWLRSDYVPREDANAFVAHLRRVPLPLLLSYIASTSGSGAGP